MLKKFFQAKPGLSAAEPCYVTLVAQARNPLFYRELGIPDNLDGRFELIVLHLFLVLNRLKAERDGPDDTAQLLIDYFIDDMDRSLREMGAGDLGVGKRVKKMAEACHGRITIYDQCLSAVIGPDQQTQSFQALVEALRRNLYGTCPDAEKRHISLVADYMFRCRATLSNTSVAQLAKGDFAFATVEPEIAAGVDVND